ncbi:CAP domain-containing protein [Paraburkholderia sp. SARCC-3016]|uniref:CAP domain-containing protein n=1 Tax=Paraburkholderia sp. SARCC-3016 TaxID=3058611 RepID=UPI00280987FD|nr:CAP domain-containing protein [Paraburkholderia sp. SARCC-3016]MDQ7980365.1 CAP domain-containing protein [Paraburkholderia sp. SARCC-3016]
MKQKKTSALTAMAIASAVVLAACGGGGGDSTGATAPASSPSGGSSPQTSIPPQTSVPPTTFPATTMQAAAFAQLNAYRLSMGVGELKQDPILDTAAQAQALYLDSNLVNGSITVLDHNEVSTLANFYATTPLDRARKAGAPVTEYIGEDISAGLPQASASAFASDCVTGLLDTVYHQADLTNNAETIGIGFQQMNAATLYACALVSGETTGVSGAPIANGLLISGGQQLPTNAVAHAPLSNETGVSLAMEAENTNPAPDVPNPGRPIMVRVNAANPGDVLTVSSFTLTAAGGAVVPARIIVPAAAVTGSASGVTADPNNLLPPGVAFLLPLTPLSANTTYIVSFTGDRDGTPVSPQSWSFTTGAN